jgi:dihydrofolate reductase
MKTVFYTAASLDGYIADLSHSLDWLFQFEDGDESSFPGFIRDVGAIVMGSNTYEWLLTHYIHEEPDQPKAWPHEQPTWVFTSRSLPGVTGADIKFVRGNVGPVSSEIHQTAGDKNVWVAGGGDLAAQFHERGLLDEIVVTLAPVLLANGAPLFTRQVVTPPLRVLEVKAHASGLTEMRLEVQRSHRGAT